MAGRWRIGLGILALLGTAPLPAQNASETMAAWKADLAALRIDPATMRRPVDGEATAPNPANFSEAGVKPYSLPSLMGERPPIDALDWPERRAQLAELVEDNLVGRIPDAAASVQVSWTTIGTETKDIGGIKAQVRTLRGATSMPDGRMGPVIEAVLTQPAKVSGRIPAIIEYSFVWPKELTPPAGFKPPPDPAIAALRRGWAYVAYYPGSVQADNGAGLTAGIIGLVSGGAQRGPTDWGVLRAWGWGASRVLDRLLAEPAIDPARIAVSGMSRYGKSALVASAYDSRFAAALISSSGAGGAKLIHREFGEQVENLATGFYYWFTPAFLRYGGPRPTADLPVDAHMLIALVAPRPLFIATGSADKGDAWVDPRGTYLATLAAAPAWRLLGKTAPSDPTMPPILARPADTTLTWYQHDEGHAAAPNWEPFLDWAGRLWDSTGGK